MGHRKLSPHSNGKPRLARALFSFEIALLILAFLAPSFDLQPVASFPIASYNTSDYEPPDAVIFLQEPPFSNENELCALWEMGSNFDNALFLERATIASFTPTLSFSFSDFIRRIFGSQRLLLSPRSPPTSLIPDLYPR
jgi:hypothetical protein